MIDELLIAFLSVDQPRVGHQAHRTAEWKQLFEFYNSNIPQGEKELNMSCGICFHKVWHFCRQRLRTATAAKIALSASLEKSKSNEFRSQNIV